MGRTLARAVIRELKSQINVCEKYKKRILGHAEELKKECITNAEHEALLAKKLIEGKTIQEWIRHYEEHIRNCEKEIKKIKRKLFVKKFSTIFFSAVVLSVLIFSAFYISPILVGFVTKEKSYTQTLNLEFADSTNYKWQLENAGYLDSVKLSGTIEGDGEVKIYLDDFLLLDSSKSENIKLTGKVIEKTDRENSIISFFKNIFSRITGRVAEKELEDGNSETSGDNDTQPDKSYSEEEEEAPQTQSPSQEESSPSEISENIDGEIAEENQEILENATEEILDTPKEEITPEEKETKITIKEFKDVCEETCKNLNLNKSFYTLRIEISNAKLKLDEIKYEIKEEVEEVKEIPEVPPENITPIQPPEENIIREYSNITQLPIHIKTIPNIQIEKNSPFEIHLKEYFYNADEFYILQVKNISSTTYNHTIKILPDFEFVGIRKIIVIAKNDFGTIESNVFSVIVYDKITGIPEINVTEIPEVNITIEPNITIEEISTETNATIITTKERIVVGKPVKWKKEIILEKQGIVKIELPKESKNISVNKITDKSYSKEEEEAPQTQSPSQEESSPSEISENIDGETEEQIQKDNESVKEFSYEDETQSKQEAKFTITGKIISTEQKEKSFFEILKNIFSSITGRVVDIQKQEEVIEVTIEDNATQYEIEYETPAPQSFEEEISGKEKLITISAPDELNYTDVLAFTELPKEVAQEKIKLYRTTDGIKENVEFVSYDNNNNSLIDYIEWIVPSLSNETYELIIEISKAEHLDENRSFISDIYEQVKALDSIWSEPINNNEYVRVTFNQKLDSSRDITLYPKIISGNPKIEVYEKDKNEIIAEFTNINSDAYNKVYLTNLVGEQDTFDLKILSGSVEFEHIVDPKANYDYNSGQGTLHFVFESATGVYPPLATDGFGGAQIGSYTNVQSDNAAYITQAGGSNTEPYFRFNFTISETPADIDSIFIHINGFSTYDGGEDATCYVHNFNTPAWETIGQMPTTDGDIVLNLTTNIVNYIQGDQFVYLCVGKNLDGPDEVSIDYTNVTVYSTAETTPPEVTINSPQNTTYFTLLDFPLTLNVSLNEAGSVMYSLDGGVTNISLNTTDNLNFNGTLDAPIDGGYTFQVYANDTLGNNNYTENVAFTVATENVIVNATITDTMGILINSTVEISYSSNGTIIYNETNVTHEELTLNVNELYDVKVNPLGIDFIEEIIFEEVNLSGSAGETLNLIEVEEIENDSDFEIIHVINPLVQDFSNATMTIIPGAKRLYECTNWNITSSSCNQNWIKLSNSMIANQEYNISLENTTSAYGEIPITNALHLDSNREFISNVFEQVRTLDGIWSETIPSGDYVRVTFLVNLTSSNDITLYPRTVSGTPSIEVYERNESTLIANFTSINDNQYNQVLLTSLSGTQNIFDLRIAGGSVEIDHIVDPSTIVLINADALATATGVATALENVGKNIVKLNNNTLIAFWTNALGSDPSCSLSSNEGVTWKAIQTETGTDVGVAVASNGTGVIYITTNAGNGAGDIAYIHQPTGACDIAGTYADAGSMLANYRPDVAYDGNNNRYVVCSVGSSDSDVDFAYTSTASISWTTAAASPSGAVTSSSCSIDADDNGNVFIASNEGATGIRVYNSSAGTFAATTAKTAYGNAVNNMHMSIRGTTILITATETSTSDLVLIWSTDQGITYTNTTYSGTFQDPEGCIDSNGQFHVVFVNTTRLSYIRYAGGSFDDYEEFADAGTERYPSARCSNFPANNRLASNELELAFTDTGTNIYFANITIDTSIPPDTIYPIFSNYAVYPANNTAYTLGGIKEFNVTIATTNGSAGLEFNGVNYTVTNLTASLFNRTIANLPAGSYAYKWWAYGSGASKNFNVSSTQHYTIAMATGSVQAFISGARANTTGIVNQTYWINASRVSGDGNMSLEVDGVSVNASFTLNNLGNLFNFTTVKNYNITARLNSSTNFTASSETWWINVTAITNTAPTITWVESIAATNPIEASSRAIAFNFTANDANGASDINVSSAQGFFQKQGETTRSNSSCLNVSSAGNNVNFTCTINIWYWDVNGTWIINVTVKDNSNVKAENSSTSFTYNLLQAIVISPSQFTFDVVMGATNQTSTNDPTTINNTGNANITSGNLKVTGINLYGETFTSQFIGVGNFSVDIDTGGTPPAECDGTTLVNGTATGITNAILPRGNLSQGGGTAQEQLYYCIKTVPTGISSQIYSTQQAGSWTVSILLVAIIPASRKKKKKKQKKIEDDKLLEALDIIADELKEKYSLNKKELIEITIGKLTSKYNLNREEIQKIITQKELEISVTIFNKKLGALESLVKYMKENLNMNYHDIAKLLNRDDRTIWTSYKKAIEKQKELIKVKEGISIPISIFKNRKFTILELVILYLREKQIRYSEISKLINRNQRNIWAIYSRAVKKIEKTEK